ncbi:uncharacterized protein LOC62_04G006262 [Vanrija pseudolonga]|uniref:2',3'-cyclic-nucleotide 3'-phosphodiesterase n=1 Tax=Vanrija pseudolonga TaxID=143232 RepID=A0AAF0YDE0_9TREE|nr:hypothetical protein LOC62_04G006262 [Vanrija pseudolonga]
MGKALEGHCLWLVPTADEVTRLQSLIDTLASQEASAPTFHPHITLLHPLGKESTSPPQAITSTLEAAVAQFNKARGATGPIKLTLDKPVAGEKYFQSVLTPVDESGDKSVALRQLRTAVEDAFDERPAVFYPHLSLLYGDLSHERRLELVAEAEKQLEFPREVVVEDAVVVDINGTAPEWKIVARVKL